MGSERRSYTATVPLRRQGAEEAVDGGQELVLDVGAPPRRGPDPIALTSGLSYACRYCGRAHYPTCW